MWVVWNVLFVKGTGSPNSWPLSHTHYSPKSCPSPFFVVYGCPPLTEKRSFPPALFTDTKNTQGNPPSESGSGLSDTEEQNPEPREQKKGKGKHKDRLARMKKLLNDDGNPRPKTWKKGVCPSFFSRLLLLRARLHTRPQSLFQKFVIVSCWSLMSLRAVLLGISRLLILIPLSEML